MRALQGTNAGKSQGNNSYQLSGLSKSSGRKGNKEWYGGERRGSHSVNVLTVPQGKRSSTESKEQMIIRQTTEIRIEGRDIDS